MPPPDPHSPEPSGADPFGTDRLRAATLRAWRESPTRLAEDVAAEAELLDIGYRDRWCTELAANAADAALAGGVPGRLLIRADGATLRFANTGAPLSVEGMRALTALRVSPKSTGAADTNQVGRFGVGFRATGFADRVDVLSVTGSITFDAGRTAEAVAEIGVGVPTEPGALPAQRLAWPIDAAPEPGYATEVVLHVDSPARAAELLETARTEAPDLLLELPALRQIAVGDTGWARVDEPDRVRLTVDGQPATVWLQAATGTHRWLVPITDGRVRPLTGDVLRSPTPTQIPLSLPARLIAHLPLTPDRRGLHPDAELAAVASGYPDLVGLVPAGQQHLLVPEPGFAAGPEDAVLRAAVEAELAAAAWVPTVDGPPVPPQRARLLRGLSDDAAAVLGEVFDGLVDPRLSDGPAARALVRLGAAELTLAEIADAVSALSRPAPWWARLYAALDPLAVGRDGADELGALPVPRADGRLQRGARGLCLVDLPPGAPPIRLDWIPLIDPDAYHPLLERLGLHHLSISEVLGHPALRAALDDDDTADHEELADAVLQLLAVTDGDATVPPWLGALEVRAADGEPAPVDELLLPGSPLAAVLADDAPLDVVDQAVVDAYGAEPLRLLGAGWGFTLIHDDLPTAADHDLDREQDWWDGLEVPPERLTAIRDLDLVDPDRWPAALELLATDDELVAALADPDGYPRWWLRRFAEIDGRPLRGYRAPDDARWRGLADPLPLPPGLAPLLAGDGPDDADDVQAWLDALADPHRDIAPGVAARAHLAMVAAERTGRFVLEHVDPPAGLRTLAGTVADEAWVIDAPWWAAVVPAGAAVLVGPHPERSVAAAFAALVDAPLASEALADHVVSTGEPLDADGRTALLVSAHTGWDLTGAVTLHRELTVAVFAGDEETRHRVARWRDDGGTLHVDAHLDRAAQSVP